MSQFEAGPATGRSVQCLCSVMVIKSDIFHGTMLRGLVNPRGNRIRPIASEKRRKNDGLEVMLSVPKKANDAMHLSLLEGCDVPTDSLGEVVLQDSFHVWDLRQIIKKGRERRVFLFDLHLLLAKEVKDSHGKAKYIYKTKFMTSELGVTEHIEGDECKFSVWTGREPMASDCRIVLKAPSLEVKQTWVRRLREVIQETYFSGALQQPPRSPPRVRPTSSQRSSRDLEETLLDETTENLDRNSLASFGSGNTTDSDKAGPEMTWVVADHTAATTSELTVTKGQQVEVVEACPGRADWWIVRVPGEPPQEGSVPSHVLKPQPQQKTSPSRRPLSQPCEEALEASNSDPGAVSAASPGKQRRGFSGRRLFGLRKPSQGKDKAPSGAQSPAAAEKPAPLKKIPSDKKLKLPYTTDNGRGADGGECSPAALDEAEDDAPDVELPPPMKPIQDPQTVLQAPAPAAAATTPAAREVHGGASTSGRGGDTEEEEQPPTPGPNTNEAILKKREYVLKELVDTEEIYVSDLRLVCEGYIRHMQEQNPDPAMPEDLKDRRYRMIFGNIEAIFEFHRDKFLKDLQACIAAPELLGDLFHRFLEKRMFLYEAYCRNKPVSEYIVSEHERYFQELRHKLGQKLQLGDLLIKPIQRIQKYHLLVKKIYTYSESANASPAVLAALRDAVHYTDIIPKNANNMMDVGRLQGFTGNITSQGKLLLQEPLTVSEMNGASEGKAKELHVFLFEQCVIFSDAVGKKSQFVSQTYNYKLHVQVNKMDFEEIEGNAFMIHSVDPNKPKQSYMCRAPSEAKGQEWTSTLSRILQSQRIFGEALENPGAYLRELHRDPARDPAAGGEGWCGLRKTESVPPSLGGRLAPELRGRAQRPHAKANTINLPTTAIRSGDRKKSASVSANNAAASPTSPPHANGLSKRPWLRMRRGLGGNGGRGEASGEGLVTELRVPELMEPAVDTAVTPGSNVTLSCSAAAARATATWRKIAPETRPVRPGGRFVMNLSPDGVATLTINACQVSDAGIYSCVISNELGGVQTSARLTVGPGYAPGVPTVRAHPGGGLVVQWNELTPVHLEYLRVGTTEWLRATQQPHLVNTLALEELPAGEYSFRLVDTLSGFESAATLQTTTGGGGAWQRQQFAGRFRVDEEIGRGRTSRVFAARDTGTGQLVAVKQVFPDRGADAMREYRILTQAANGGIVRALALFAEVPSPGAYTIVMEMVDGGPLLEWVASHPEMYTQQMVGYHTKRLMIALSWLHDRNIAHLDVRPENMFVELYGQHAQLKLIDLGSAMELTDAAAAAHRVVLPPAPSHLEFAAPECVMGRPPSTAWDCWATGVFLYVFLTGLSPFLDESVEETTTNIIMGDFCFPVEYWQDIGERPQRLIRDLLEGMNGNRMTMRGALLEIWFDEAPACPLPVGQLKTFLDRRRPARVASPSPSPSPPVLPDLDA